MPCIIAIGLLVLPESPRWLLQMNKEEKARRALHYLSPSPEFVDGDLASMKMAIDHEAALAQSAEIVDLWRSPVDRRRALLAIGAVVLQPASGASYIISELIVKRLINQVANCNSLQYLFLRNGRDRLSVSEQLHLGGRRFLRFNTQQPHNYEMGLSEDILVLGNDNLWLIAADHGRRLHCTSRENFDWKGNPRIHVARYKIRGD